MARNCKLNAEGRLCINTDGEMDPKCKRNEDTGKCARKETKATLAKAEKPYCRVSKETGKCSKSAEGPDSSHCTRNERGTCVKKKKTTGGSKNRKRNKKNKITKRRR